MNGVINRDEEIVYSRPIENATTDSGGWLYIASVSQIPDTAKFMGNVNTSTNNYCIGRIYCNGTAWYAQVFNTSGTYVSMAKSTNIGNVSFYYILPKTII